MKIQLSKPCARIQKFHLCLKSEHSLLFLFVYFCVINFVFNFDLCFFLFRFRLPTVKQSSICGWWHWFECWWWWLRTIWQASVSFTLIELLCYNASAIICIERCVFFIIFIWKLKLISVLYSYKEGKL